MTKQLSNEYRLAVSRMVRVTWLFSAQFPPNEFFFSITSLLNSINWQSIIDVICDDRHIGWSCEDSNLSISNGYIFVAELIRYYLPMDKYSNPLWIPNGLLWPTTADTWSSRFGPRSMDQAKQIFVKQLWVTTWGFESTAFIKTTRRDWLYAIAEFFTQLPPQTWRTSFHCQNPSDKS